LNNYAAFEHRVVNYWESGPNGPYVEFYLPEISNTVAGSLGKYGAVACVDGTDNAASTVLPTLTLNQDVMLFIFKSNKPTLITDPTYPLADLIFAGNFYITNTTTGDFESPFPAYKDAIKYSDFSDFAKDKNYMASNLGAGMPANKDYFKMSWNPSWNNRFHRYAKCWKIDPSANCLSLDLKLSNFALASRPPQGRFEICPNHLSLKLPKPLTTNIPTAVGDQIAITCFE